MVVELWLLFPIVTQIQPSRVYLFDQCNFPVAARTLEFLLTRNRVAYVAKVSSDSVSQSHSLLRIDAGTNGG